MSLISVPLRYFLVVLRGTYLKGVGMDILWPQMAAMAALGFGLLTIAILRFHKGAGLGPESPAPSALSSIPHRWRSVERCEPYSPLQSQFPSGIYLMVIVP